MSPAVKSLAALAAAVAMVTAAVLGRSALDDKKVHDDLRVIVVCDPLAEAFCRAAKVADPRLMIRPESPDVTTKKLEALPPGAEPDFQAWVTVGPWLQMADGRRLGQPHLERGVTLVGSSALVLVTRLGQNLCAKAKPAACLPLPRLQVGLPSPRTSGVGLAGLAQVVLADTGLAAGDLDRSAIESGPAAPVIDRLAQSTSPRAGFEQISANFSQANPVVSTQAAAVSIAGRASVIRSEPSVRAVLQVGILDSRATAPLRDGAGGKALVKAAADAGWDPPADPAGGLPEPGVLAALQDAWTGP